MNKVILLFLSFCVSLSHAQNTDFSIKADTNAILIGESLLLTLSGEINVGDSYQWPFLPDTIAGLSTLDLGKIDSLIENERLFLTQEIRVTSFDSGFVQIPKLVFLRDSDSTFSKSLVIKVSLTQAQADTELFDIKAPLDPAINWLPWLYLALGLIAIVALIIWLFKRFRKKGDDSKGDSIPTLAPIDWALQQLAKLEEQKLWQAGHQKQYYSELIDILRYFLEREFSVKAMESTAEELIQKLKKLKLAEEDFISLSKTLRLSSMVKFAKQQAVPYEHEASLQAVKDLVLKTQLKKAEKKEEEHE
jgi:hypothetical protein